MKNIEQSIDALKKPTDGPLSYFISNAEKLKKPNVEKTSENAQKMVTDLLVKNPNINAQTFLNLLKKEGINFVIDKSLIEKPPGENQTQADSASSFPQMLRDKGSQFKQSNVGNVVQLKFLETDAKPADPLIGFTRFKTILIQEGIGNMRDAFYYTKEALKSAMSVFEGKKIFADHPTDIEETTRPERSVRDVLGHFENVQYVENEGRGALEAEVVIPPDPPFQWARSLMGHAVEYSKKYPDKDFIGLSINATGDANEEPIDKVIAQAPQGCVQKLNEAKAKGISSVKLVYIIADAVSTDLVTEAGAGGRILDMLENNKGEKKMEDIAKHDDEMQDVELIKKMLKKYLGDETDATVEECNVAKEAQKAFGEMGYSEEEAEKAAVHALKLSKHMASKKENEEAKKENEEVKKVEESKEVEESASLPIQKKESAKEVELQKEILKLRGQLASFTESEKKLELAKYLDKKCADSKLPSSITKGIKESIKSAKTKESVDELFNIFMEGYKSRKVSSDTDFKSIISTEKTDVAAGSKKSISFGGIEI